MIPKIIHYGWFGGKSKPELALKCIESWKTYCPDYEIIEWNESNFDLNLYCYTKEAFETKNMAFITDVVRLYALYNYGGIWMDTDVELVKSLDSLLQYEAVSGFEKAWSVQTALMGSEKGQKMVKELLGEYNDLHFIKKDGTLDLTTNVMRITNACKKYGFIPNNTFQTLNGFTLLPNDYLCPKNYDTKDVIITNNTICIHHFAGSWLPEEVKYMEKKYSKYKKFLPQKIAMYLAVFVATKKFHGIVAAIKKMFKWMKRKK